MNVNRGEKELFAMCLCVHALRLGEEGKMYLAISYKYRARDICRSGRVRNTVPGKFIVVTFDRNIGVGEEGTLYLANY